MDIRTVQAAMRDAGLRLVTLGTDIVNLNADTRELTRADVNFLRTVLTEAGYAEESSWMASTGTSWLNTGIPSVSIRIAPPHTPEGAR